MTLPSRTQADLQFEAALGQEELTLSAEGVEFSDILHQHWVRRINHYLPELDVERREVLISSHLEMLARKDDIRERFERKELTEVALQEEVVNLAAIWQREMAQILTDYEFLRLLNIDKSDEVRQFFTAPGGEE